MNRLNQILAFLLIIQIMLAAVILFPRPAAELSIGEPLLAGLTPGDVTELVIRDGTGSEVVVAKNDDGVWGLPNAGGYPVRATAVSDLLGKLEDLETSRPVAVNPSSHKRLKVSGDDFERLVEIKQGGEASNDYRLYIGSTAGASAAYMRINDDPNVYLVRGLAAWEVTAQVSSWIDTLFFSAPKDDVVAVTLENANGVFEFEKVDDAWVFKGLAEGETLDPAGVDTLLSRATSVRMTAPIGKEGVSIDTPQATITLTVREEVTPPAESATAEPTEEGEAAEPEPTLEVIETTYTLRVGDKLEDADGYVFASSESDYYVRISTYNGEGFLDLTRDDFLVAPATPTPTEEAPAPTTEGEDEGGS